VEHKNREIPPLSTERIVAEPEVLGPSVSYPSGKPKDSELMGKPLSKKWIRIASSEPFILREQAEVDKPEKNSVKK